MRTEQAAERPLFNPLLQFRFRSHGGRKERRIEHLKGDSGGRDTDARQFADLALGAAGRYHAKRLAQVIRHILKGHLRLV